MPSSPRALTSYLRRYGSGWRRWRAKSPTASNLTAKEIDGFKAVMSAIPEFMVLLPEQVRSAWEQIIAAFANGREFTQREIDALGLAIGMIPKEIEQWPPAAQAAMAAWIDALAQMRISTDEFLAGVQRLSVEVPKAMAATAAAAAAAALSIQQNTMVPTQAQRQQAGQIGSGRQAYSHGGLPGGGAPPRTIDEFGIIKVDWGEGVFTYQPLDTMVTQALSMPALTWEDAMRLAGLDTLDEAAAKTVAGFHIKQAAMATKTPNINQQFPTFAAAQAASAGPIPVAVMSLPPGAGETGLAPAAAGAAAPVAAVVNENVSAIIANTDAQVQNTAITNAGTVTSEAAYNEWVAQLTGTASTATTWSDAVAGGVGAVNDWHTAQAASTQAWTPWNEAVRLGVAEVNTYATAQATGTEAWTPWSEAVRASVAEVNRYAAEQAAATGTVVPFNEAVRQGVGAVNDYYRAQAALTPATEGARGAMEGLGGAVEPLAPAIEQAASGATDLGSVLAEAGLGIESLYEGTQQAGMALGETGVNGDAAATALDSVAGAADAAATALEGAADAAGAGSEAQQKIAEGIIEGPGAQAQHGALLSGPTSGFMAMLHGNELVLPMNDRARLLRTAGRARLSARLCRGWHHQQSQRLLRQIQVQRHHGIDGRPDVSDAVRRDDPARGPHLAGDDATTV